MTKKKTSGLDAVLNAIQRPPSRSSLFYWMVENHDRMIEGWSERVVRWAVLCAQFEALGLTDQRGNPASVSTAKHTWASARKVVQEAKAHRQFGIKKSATRGWARAPVPQPSRPDASVQSLPPATAAGPDDPTLDPTRPDLEGKIPREVVEARKAAMMKTLAERSGR